MKATEIATKIIQQGEPMDIVNKLLGMSGMNISIVTYRLAQSKKTTRGHKKGFTNNQDLPGLNLFCFGDSLLIILKENSE